MALTLLSQYDIREKRILLRFDGDVPVEEGKIVDDFRLQAVLPTIRYAREQGALVVLLAHRGRPKGKPDPSLSNQVLADYFTQAVQESVTLEDGMINATTRRPIVLLENLRFHRAEETNEPGFARLLAQWGDMYCNDAFAVSHRAHASVVGLAQLLPHCAGFRLAEEIQTLSPLCEEADAPYCVVLGGAKASDKTPIIWDLIDRVDTLLVGGLIAIPFLAAMGHATGAHEVIENDIQFAQKCIRRIHEENLTFHIPTDFINQDRQVKPITAMTKNDLMVDIGPQTRAQFDQELCKANTIFWNGAMGKFEDPAFAAGTIAVARSIGASGAEVRIGSGGDTVSAIHEHNLASAFTYISTGGGATLEFIAGRDLPGIAALAT